MSDKMKKAAALKRIIDLTIASVGLVLAAPLLLFTGLGVLICMGPPVLFRQKRPGLRGKPFVIYKFRTMRVCTDQQNALSSDGLRLTPFGRILRATSLDELPELYNVLKGDMSLVGPRPLLMEYLERYTGEQMRRHEVKPGITGWAQINGRNSLSWDEKFKLDVWYVDHGNLWLDIKIIWLTLVKTIKREGISARGHDTMPEFEGSGTYRHGT